MSEQEFDVVVIGAGSSGEVLAGRLGENRVETAIVERELVGGECSYYACMPSKALLRPSEALREVGRVPGAAEAVTGELDVEAALKRRDEVISDLDDSGQLPWLEAHNVELFRGDGRLDGERRVKVGDDVLVARKAVVVASGTAAAIPPIDGLAEVSAWSNREITTTKQVPERLIVLGGGAVGAEMADAWSSFGSEVSIVEAEERLLPTEEPFAGEQLAEAFTERGIDVHVGSKAIRASRDGTVKLELEGGTALEGDQILVAVGRKALTDDIGLATVGIEPGGFLEVDDQMRVDGSDWLYAVGDVNGRSLLTHMGKYQSRLAADQIIGKEGIEVSSDQRGSPRVVFTDPQVAAVGMTLADAEQEGIEARAVDVPTSGTAGASFYGRNTDGTTRIVVDTEREVIVGATFVGAEIADFLHAATIAVIGEVPLDRLWHAVPAFPTRSELWLNLMEEYGL